MNESGFRDREGQSLRGRDAAEGAVMALQELDVSPVRSRCHCNHKVINVGEDQAPGDGGVEGGDIDNEQEGGDGAALRGAHSNWCKHLWRPLEEGTRERNCFVLFKSCIRLFRLSAKREAN